MSLEKAIRELLAARDEVKSLSERVRASRQRNQTLIEMLNHLANIIERFSLGRPSESEKERFYEAVRKTKDFLHKTSEPSEGS